MRLRLATLALLASAILLTEPLRGGQWCSSGIQPPKQPNPPDPPPPCCPAPAGSSAGGGDACRQKSPCYVGSGIYVTGTLDLELPSAAGFPLRVGRTYQSSHGVDGPFGVGWTSNLVARLYYATYLFAAPSTYQKEADVTMPDGARYRFIENADGSFSPPAGRYDSLVRKPDGSYDLTYQRSRAVYHFSATGAIAFLSDDSGNQTTFAYDASGRLQQLVDASGSGRFVNVYWGGDGRISSLQDSTGHQVTYSYNQSNGTLTSVTDSASRTTRYSYAAGRFAPLLSQISDNWNRVITTITYDSADRTQSYTENGETYTYTYGYGNNPLQTAKADSSGNTWVFPFGSNSGLVTDEVPPPGSGGATKHTDYNPDTSIQQRTDETGVKTLYAYDSSGNVVSTTQDSQGSLAVRYDYSFDPAFPGRVTSVTPKNPATNAVDPDWQAWQYDYYQAGSTSPGSLFHVTRVNSDGTTQVVATYQYDTRGRVTSQTTATGAQTTYAYDTQGTLQTITAPANNDAGVRPVTTYGYDSSGRVTSVTDPLGKVTNYTYDNAGRVFTVTLPKPSPSSTLNFTTTYTYDNYDAISGLLFTNVTDPNGKLTKLGYDAFGRLLKSVDALNNATSYAYTKNLLSSITDANNNVTSYQYDVLKRFTRTTFPDGAFETYTYRTDGLLATKTDRKNQTITYGYDSLKRLASKTYSTGGAITATYQGQKLTQVVDTTVTPNETHTFSYDNSYRLQANTQATRGSVSYTYQPDDRVATTTTQAGPTAAYAYYPDGSLNALTWGPISGQFKYSYDLTGRYQQTTFPNGQARTYAYDDQGRLTSLANALGATTLATYAYGYDLNNVDGTNTMLGQRTSLTSTVPSQGFTNALTKFSYDPLYQLTKGEYPNVAPFGGEVDSWTYDSIGNRLANTVNGTTQTYGYLKNGTNPLNGQRLQTDGVNSYAYDANGNLATQAGGQSFTFGYNAENRQTGIAGAVAATYGYDFHGRRATKVVGASSTSYLYDGQNLVRDTNGGVTSDYLFGPSIDEPLAEYKTGAITYFDVDGLGSVVTENDATGNVTRSTIFDAWGATRTETGTRLSPFAYTGREVGEAGQLFYRARYYQPSIGRFQQEDPVQQAGRLTSSNAVIQPRPVSSGKSLYAYVGSNPALYTDPSGLARVANCSCKPVPASGNPGPGQGSGPQVQFEIPNDCQIYGSGNPIPGTGSPGVTDIDFIQGVKYRGTDTFPTWYIYSDCKGGTYISLLPPLLGLNISIAMTGSGYNVPLPPGPIPFCCCGK